MALMLLGAVMLAACSDDNPTTPVDTTAPTIVGFTPADGDTDVAVDAAVQVVFSEAMAQATANTASVRLVGGTLTGLSWPDDHTLAVAHAPFTPGSHVTLQVGTALTDAAGNHLAAPGQASFTVAAPVDTIPPTVLGITPANGATGVAPDMDVVVAFSEAMDQSTAVGNVTMTGGTITSLEWTAPDTLVVHHETWTMKSQVVVTVGTGLADLAGNHLAEAVTSTFSVTVPDTTPPTVTGTTPADGAAEVALDAEVSLTFSESMDQASVAGHVAIAETDVDSLTWSDDRTVVVHHPDFPAGTEIHVTVDDDVTDLAGNRLADTFTFSFTTLVPDTTPPTVLGITPADGATDVSPDTDVVIVFSEPMDQATADGNVTMTGGTITSLEWTAADTLVVHHEAWTLKSMVTVTVGTGLADLAGNHLAAPVSSTFSVTVPDTTPPVITGFTPAAGSTDAGVDQWIYIDFSEPVDQLSVQDALTMTPAGTIQWRWYDGWTRLAIIHPNWDPGTEVTVSIGTGLTDQEGNHLETPFTATFVVGSDDVCDPQLLYSSVVDGQTDVSQDVQIRLNFSEDMDTSGDWPDVWLEGADMDTFSWVTPYSLWIDHEPLPLGATVTLHVGSGLHDLAGKPLINPHEFTFTVTDQDVIPPEVEEVIPATGSSDVPGNQVVVFIFTEPMDTLTAAGAITMSAGEVTRTWWHDPYALVVEHTDWTSGTEVTVTAGTELADPAGNHLAEPASTTFTVTDADHTPPYVELSSPADGDTEVAPDAPLQFTFSEPVAPVDDPALVSMEGGTITGLEWQDEQTLQVYHDPWPLGETVTVTVDTLVFDFAHNYMAAPYTITFTIAGADTTPPHLVSTTPADGETDVDPNQQVRLVFDEPMAPYYDGGSVSLSNTAETWWHWEDDQTLVTTWHTAWADGAEITLTVTDGLHDQAGNPLANPQTVTFTVSSPPAPPEVVSIDPADGATDVPADQDVTITFSKAMDPGTAEGNVTMDGGTITLLEWTAPDVLVVHHEEWTQASTVTVTVGVGMTDLEGRGLAAPAQSIFTVAADLTPPEVVSIDPADGAVDVPINQDVLVTFSEPMDQFCAANYLQMSGGGITTIEWLDDQRVLLHHDPWTPGEVVTVTVQAGACDLAGNTLPLDVTATFTVTNDTTPPELVYIDPPDGDSVYPDLDMIVLEFSEPIDPESFSLAEVNGQLAVLLDTDNVTWSPDGTVMTIPLRGPIPNGATLHAVIGHFEDLAGNANTVTTSWTVTEDDPGDLVIVDPWHVYGFLTRGYEQANPVWDGQWYTEYRHHTWEDQPAGDFRLNYLDTPDQTPLEWDYFTISYPWLLMRGFHETDGGDAWDTSFFDPVQYMPLAPSDGETWAGSTLFESEGDTLQVLYEGEVLAGTTDVEVPQPDPEQAVADRLFWQGCRTIVLEHTVLAGTDTVEVGVDTLRVVTGYGLVEERNYSVDYMEGGWSWDQSVMNARLDAIKSR